MLAENQRDDQFVVRTENGDLVSPIQNSFPERYVKSYESEVEHFLDILEGKIITSQYLHSMLKLNKFQENQNVK